MAEKPPKIFAITIKRRPDSNPRFILSTGFKIRQDKATGYLDILFEVPNQKGERVTFDPGLMKENTDILKKYVAAVTIEANDAAVVEDVSVSDQTTFSNILHFSQMGGRSETIFGVFSIGDWVDATKQQAMDPHIFSTDKLSIMSPTAVQKKMLLELIMILAPPAK